MQNNDHSTLVGAGAGLVAFLVVFCIALAVYLFFCYCNKRICEKCGTKPGVLIWIPILQIIPMLEAAKMPIWMIILFLIPFVNLIMAIMMWVKICTNMGKNALLVIGIILLPIIFIPYLAFAD